MKIWRIMQVTVLSSFILCLSKDVSVTWFDGLIMIPRLASAAERVSPVADEDAFLVQYLWEEFRALPADKRPKVGVALGGGGARGLAHVGVLKVLDEEDIPVDMLVGTSVGALIGALYAAGVPPMRIEHLAEEIGWSKLTNLSRVTFLRLLLAQKQLSSKQMERYLSAQFGDLRFDQLRIPFACVACDLQTGEKIVFTEGPVALAARASATIPGLFEPVPYRHRYLIDGGLVDNIPTDMVRFLGADLILAVAVSSDFSRLKPYNIFSSLNQAMYIQGERLAQEQVQQADFVLRPKLEEISSVDLSRSRECIDAGILAARKAVRDLKQVLLGRALDRIIARRSTL